MELFLKEILYVVLIMVIPICAKYVTLWLDEKKQETAKLTEQTEYEITQKYIEQAIDTVSAVVSTVSQTFVDKLKEQGSFDTTNAIIAKNMAIEQATTLLSNAAKECIIQTYGDLNEFLDVYIESIIKASK